jgi:hypothetical protein
MNNKQLRNEIRRLEIDAQEQSRLHDMEFASAIALEGDDDAKAAILHANAHRHEEKKNEHESLLAKYKNQLAHQEQEAAQLRQQLDHEQAQHDAKVAELRKRIDNLEGASLF